MAIANDSLSFEGTRTEDSGSTSSGTPPTLVAMIGTRAAMLSSKTFGEPSDNDGSTRRSAIENSPMMSEQ